MVNQDLIRNLINTYAPKSHPNDEIVSVGASMLAEVQKQKSSLPYLVDDDESDTNKPQNAVPESLCHSFYRMLGLPVVHKDKITFYNPGHYGAKNLNQSVITAVDQNQDSDLKKIEIQREAKSLEYGKLYEDSQNLFYKLDVLLYPRSVELLESSALKVKLTDQKQTIKYRSKYQETYHILRPFKCSSDILKKIDIYHKHTLAPFAPIEDAKIFGDPIKRQYLETVCWIRFANSQLLTDTQSDPYLQQISTKLNLYNSIATGSQISKFSAAEAYIVDSLLSLLINSAVYIASLNVQLNKLAQNTIREGIQENVGISSEYDPEIASIQSKKDTITGIITTMPPEIIDYGGNLIKLNNTFNAALTPQFISLLSIGTNQLDAQLKKRKEFKAKFAEQINSINKNSFYMIGEVSGLGVIDIISIMLAFWSISQESLLSFLDSPAFNRMYMHRELRNKLVQDRYTNGSAPKTIEEALNELDTAVCNNLSLAKEVINYGANNLI